MRLDSGKLEHIYELLGETTQKLTSEFHLLETHHNRLRATLTDIYFRHKYKNLVFAIATVYSHF